MFESMAKVTYSVYLFHEALMNVFFSSQEQMEYIDHLEAVIVFFTFMVLSYVLGTLFILLVDSPLSNIDKVYIFPDKKNRELKRKHKILS